MRDSVWTFLRKYRLAHPGASLEAEQQACEAADYVCPPRLCLPAPAVRFSCYDPVAERLKDGRTLSLMQVRALISTNVALHQDERFYDLMDGSWYLRGQQLINDQLSETLQADPNQRTNLSVYLQGIENGVFWSLDPRFRCENDQVTLLVKVATSDQLQIAQAWLADRTEEQFLTLTQVPHPAQQSALQTVLRTDERFVQVRPDQWSPVALVPQAPALEEFEVVNLDNPTETQLIVPSFPDPPSGPARHNAQFSLTLGVAELRLGYLAVPGPWQSAFQDRHYPVTWQTLDQTYHLHLWAEGGLLYGIELQIRLWWAGTGAGLTVQKRRTGEVLITEELGVAPAPPLFTPAELQGAQETTLWEGLTDGVARTVLQLEAHWSNLQGRELTLAEYRAVLLNPHWVRSSSGYAWQPVAWDLTPWSTAVALPDWLDLEDDLARLLAGTDLTPQPRVDLILNELALEEMELEPGAEPIPDLGEIFAQVVAVALVAHPVLDWAALSAQLSRLESCTPPLTRRQPWHTLLTNLRAWVGLGKMDMALVESLWRGDQPHLTNMVSVQARTVAFFRSQLPLALLPSQGALSDFQECIRTHYDCADQDPSTALIHLILPALGYENQADHWTWRNAMVDPGGPLSLTSR
ncbi:hypothetical protein [Candidatus Cyanaurora vandensis]|uniref:hypothetical protein n=1 Tax=Candidatus Cyanaurora vandensis TaxID=2714958 RepID=UPI0025803A39|nr:hypothetical protein [Candidatus Cyanaurora vandensis]